MRHELDIARDVLRDDLSLIRTTDSEELVVRHCLGNPPEQVASLVGVQVDEGDALAGGRAIAICIDDRMDDNLATLPVDLLCHRDRVHDNKVSVLLCDALVSELGVHMDEMDNWEAIAKGEARLPGSI